MRIDVNVIKRLISQTISGFRSTPIPCQVSYGFLLLGLIIVLLSGKSTPADASIVESLTVVPFRLLPPNFWIWTVGTFWFVETNFVLLVCHLLCVHISGVVLYTLWGWREWVRYFVVTNLVAALVAVAISSIIYMLTKWESWYFYSYTDPNNIRGLSAFDGAVFVAVKQALPDTVIFHTPWFGRYKNSHFPFTAVVIGIVVTAVGLLSPVYLMQFLFGSYVGWIYLRFYQKHTNVGSRGDPSDNFTFASFFPSILQPPISVVSDAVYRAAIRLKLVKPAVRRFVAMEGIGGSLQNVVTPSTVASNQADAERRRQKALRDLNERLSKAKDQSQTTLAWPSLVDDEDEEDRKQSRPTTHATMATSVDIDKAEPNSSLSSVTVDVPTPSSSKSTTKETNITMNDL